jgi:hypothetical protein
MSGACARAVVRARVRVHVAADSQVCHVIEQRSLETHVKGQQLSVEERAQMAYHAAEAVDALLAGIDANFPEDEDERLANERASLLALLYRDIQQSHHWLVPFLNVCRACAVVWCVRLRMCGRACVIQLTFS